MKGIVEDYDLCLKVVLSKFINALTSGIFHGFDIEFGVGLVLHLCSNYNLTRLLKNDTEYALPPQRLICSFLILFHPSTAKNGLYYVYY